MNFNIRTKLVALISSAVLFGLTTVSANAISFGLGVSGGATYADIKGTETMNTSGNTQSAEEGVAGATGSVYGAVMFMNERFGRGNGFAIGYEHYFGEASLKDQVRGSAESPIVDKFAVNTSGSGINKAEGTISNMRTYFIETPGFTPMGIYFKAGMSSMDINTDEELHTGGSYGNGSVDGTVLGFGFKKTAENGLTLKSEFSTTDWDDITLSNQTATQGAKNVKIEPEAWNFKFGVGWNF